MVRKAASWKGDGKNADAARRYCEAISKAFSPPSLRGEVGGAQRRSAPKRLARVRALVAEMGPAIDEGVAMQNPCHAASWRYLQAHTQLAVMFADALAAKYSGQEDSATALTRKMFDWARRNERRLQSVFDVFEFQKTVGSILGVDEADVG